MKKIDNLINTNFKNTVHVSENLANTAAHFLKLGQADLHLWCILRNHQLTLLTDDTHLAARARLQTHPLRNYMNKQLNLQISKVDVKVIGLPLASFDEKKYRYQCSGHAAAVMGSIAQTIEDEGIRTALLSLARTLSRTSQPEDT